MRGEGERGTRAEREIREAMEEGRCWSEGGGRGQGIAA